ncbi:homoserine-O-transacetylase [Ascobolus immersus RN42]|uniref:Homoserine-O-transacetylase n=2 Tax=Ascobolus immersus TaxID=5191 RepID=A0A3N4HL87_ASCIM|nr:homoserine-O-transacetylase [Ascobolus immersus]RPA74592.1 homoserine-O-transacetylase [Ascobolus immersus RN42]
MHLVDRVGANAPHKKYERVTTQPENPFFNIVHNQSVAIIPSFTLESGVILYDCPVAYKTFGVLNESADNVMVICHALTGSADVEDWWGPLIGPGRAFDTSRYFIVCCNSMGSPYGSASPCTLDSTTGRRYGPEFPLTTVRDDVRIHKLIMDDLGVRQIAVVIGGSMGGMLALEWAYFGKDYVKAVVALATSARHSAWCISWGEAQRQSIYSDPKYDDGYYSFSDPPYTGLGAARMSALLTYRSRNSFESRFGRNIPDPSRHPYINTSQPPSHPAEEHYDIHNEGFRNRKGFRRSSTTTSDAPPSPTRTSSTSSTDAITPASTTPLHPSRAQPSGIATPPNSVSDPFRPVKRPCPTYFSAQSYLRYQADKFVKRFDANCYIAITRKLDTHDVSRGRTSTLHEALAMIEQPTLIIGIESDGLFTFAEQMELAEYIPDARLKRIDSPEGHDAFLIMFAEVNRYICEFLREVQPEIMGKEGVHVESKVGEIRASTTGEVEDITHW